MSRDVITVGLTMRIPLLYRGENSQWRERFMNYLEEQTDGELLIRPITHGEQSLPVITQVSLVGAAPNAPHVLKDPKLHMRSSKYGEQDRKAAILYKYETFKATEGEQLLDTYIHYLQVIKDLKKCGYKKDNYPLALVAEKTKVSKRREKVIVNSDSEESDDEDIKDLKKITALLAKAFNQKKFYAKPTNNNLRTSSPSTSVNKKPEYVKQVEKKKDGKKRDMSKVTCYNCKKEGHFAKDCKKAKVKDYKYYKTKMLLAKKDGDDQVLLAEDQLWMQMTSSDSEEELSANMVFMAKMEKILPDSEESSSSDKETLVEVSYYSSHYESKFKFDETSYYYDNSEPNYDLFANNDDDQEFFHDAIEPASEKFNENLVVSQNEHDESEVDNNESEYKDHLVDKLIFNFTQKIAKCQKRIEKVNQQNKDLELQNKALQDKINVLNNQVNTFEEKSNEFDEQMKVLKEPNDDLLAHMKTLEEQLKRVFGLEYTPMFLTHSDEALEIERFKRERENKIQFAYDYGNLNASYVNELIKFSNDNFQEIINPNFEKIDYPVQQTSSLKPYVPIVVLEKIIINLENEVVSLLEKEKEHLDIIESLKSKGFESCESENSNSENQNEKECYMVEKDCDNLENSNVIAPRMFRIQASQNVSPVFVSKTSCASNKIDSKIKRKRRKRTSSKYNDKQVNNDFLRANRDFFHFSDLDIYSSVRRPKRSSVIWQKKGSSNAPCVDLSFFRNLNLNKDVKRYSRKDLLSCNNQHRVNTKCAYACNDAMNVFCNSRLHASYDINDMYVFDDMNLCNRALLTNFVEKFIGTVHFGNDDFVVITSYGDVVIGSMTIKKVCYVEDLPEMKFKKIICVQRVNKGRFIGNIKKSKTAFASNMPLYLLHMDLCGPMCVKSFNGKRYVLVVVDDYSRYTWVFFLHSKDEASEVIISFIKKTKVNLQLQVQRVQTDNGIEFKNKILAEFFDKVGIN
ncbi:retrovirus-related pol polyprotein from transposon TNT 1-94 [Tanacetum coccineum]